MSRYGKWSEKKIAQFEKEGRGLGTGATYLPWIEVTDLSSRGDSRRVYSRLTNRMHHLLSTIEFDFFVLAEFTPDIVDIREQFPLPRDDTLSIAAQLGIPHPMYPGSKVPTVMTADFVITREREGKRRFEAYNCKAASEANDARSIAKLEIQRRLFLSDGIAHHIVFDSALPAKKIKNIKWIRDASLSDTELEPYKDYYDDHCSRLLRELPFGRQDWTLAEYCKQYDAQTGATPGTALRVARILLGQRLLLADLNQPDLPSMPVSMFKRPSATGRLMVVGA